MKNQRRNFLMRLRKRIKPKRRMDAVSVDGRVVTYKCRECGAKDTTTYSGQREAKFYADWHSEAKGGCSGSCQKCTKAARDKAHPLPPRQR